MYEAYPANKEVQNTIWLKARICVRDTEQMKHHAHHLDAGGILETNDILGVIFSWTALVHHNDWANVSSAKKMTYRRFF